MESQSDNGQNEVEGERIYLQEQFNEQVEDSSRLADQVLSEQKEAHEEDGCLMLFIP